MSSIVTAVLKATIGLLVIKGRDKAAEELKDGDLTDQRIRELIVREIDDIKSKLDGLARKDLLTSISYFKRGVAYLFELLNKAETSKDDPEESLRVGLCATATSAAGKTVCLTEGLKDLRVADVGDADKRALLNAKEEFKVAGLKATEAFNNEALSTSDRIQAMVIRVAATVLEKVDYPEDAIAASKLCLEELHSMPVVQGSFAIEFKKGFWAWFSRAERREIIFTVYRLNRAVYDVTQIVCGWKDSKWMSNWPCVDYREEIVDLLRDPRVAETLRKQGLGHYWKPVPKILSHGYEWQPEWQVPVAITTNTEGQLIVADCDKLKVYDRWGNFVHCLVYPTDDRTKNYDVASDKNDNIYALVELNPISFPVSDLFELSEVEFCLYCFEKPGDPPCKFPLKVGHRYHSLAVSDNNKVLLLGTGVYPSGKDAVDVLKPNGEFVHSFGEGILSDASDITAANDGLVMVLDRVGSFVQVFSDEGEHLSKFQLEASSRCTKIAFSRWNEHVVVAGEGKLLIYTKGGHFVREYKLDTKKIQGITFVSKGCVGAACIEDSGKSKVVVCEY